MIEITVSDVLSIPKGKAFSILRDYQNYYQWWPVTVRTVKGKEQYIEFSPIPGITVGWEESWVAEDSEIEVSYVKGPFRGTGSWCLEEVDKKRIELSYDVRLKPINKLIDYLARTEMFRRRHQRDILNIMHALESRAN